MRTKILLAVFTIVLLLNTVSAETFKYGLGTVFQIDKTIYMVSGYQGTSYELTSTTSTIYVDRAVIDTWSPMVLESYWEGVVRKIKQAAVIGGVIKPEFYGDVNGDGQFTKADAVLTTAVYGGTGTFNAYQTVAADVNGDGVFNKTDAVMMVAYYFDPASATSTRIGVPIPNALSTTSPTPVPIVTGVIPVISTTPIITTTPPPPQTTDSPLATVSYYTSTFSSNGLIANQLNVKQGSDVTVYITLSSTGYTHGTLKTEVRRDISFSTSGWVDNNLVTFSTEATLQPNKNTILAGAFKANDLTGVSNFVQYYIRVSWNDRLIYDPDIRDARGSVTTYLLSTDQQNQPQYYRITATSTPTPAVTVVVGGGSVNTPTVTPTMTSQETPKTTTLQGYNYDCPSGFKPNEDKTACVKSTPGFEAIFAIAGLVVTSYLILRQGNKTRR